MIRVICTAHKYILCIVSQQNIVYGCKFWVMTIFCKLFCWINVHRQMHLSMINNK